MLALFSLLLSLCAVLVYSIYWIYTRLNSNDSGEPPQEKATDDDCAPSSSSDGSVAKGPYDVFLSFRGEDTRTGFLSHLYTALDDRGIITFRDDVRLPRGKSVKSELDKAIRESRFAIIVFSKNYADSSWCLDELVKIVESEPKKFIIPVFYDVTPSDIRHQRKSVAEALTKHRNTDGERMHKWKYALTMAANISGYPVSASRDESACIQSIVAHVHRELSRTISSSSEGLVGIKPRVNEVIEMLKIKDLDKVFAVGIWKMGGAGKTTIARAIFDKLRYSYEGSCFLQIPIGEHSENGLKDLQKTLLSELLNLKPEDIKISDPKQGINMMKEKLHKKKVLIVLDNVDHRDQLNALAEEHKQLFGRGSRIIITTRNNQLLDEVKEWYEVELLSNSEAMQLFSWYAFRKSEPPEDFTELSSQVVKYAKGLPLALQVLGSHLKGLSLEEGSRQIIKLQKIPHDDILKVLEISYDGLDEIDKSIFLDVACLFRGKQLKEVVTVLDSFESYYRSGIHPLIRKSLVYVDPDGRIEMHDLVHEMGRSIALKNHPRSRLCEKDEIINVLNGSQVSSM